MTDFNFQCGYSNVLNFVIFIIRRLYCSVIFRFNAQSGEKKNGMTLTV